VEGKERRKRFVDPAKLSSLAPILEEPNSTAVKVDEDKLRQYKRKRRKAFVKGHIEKSQIDFIGFDDECTSQHADARLAEACYYSAIRRCLDLSDCATRDFLFHFISGIVRASLARSHGRRARDTESPEIEWETGRISMDLYERVFVKADVGRGFLAGARADSFAVYLRTLARAAARRLKASETAGCRPPDERAPIPAEVETIHQAAHALGVDPSTITRWSRKKGFGGWVPEAWEQVKEHWRERQARKSRAGSVRNEDVERSTESRSPSSRSTKNARVESAERSRDGVSQRLEEENNWDNIKYGYMLYKNYDKAKADEATALLRRTMTIDEVRQRLAREGERFFDDV
jgi:hypothetical protein